MLNTLYGMYLVDKYSIKSDIILWTKSITANGTLNLTLNDAINGSSLKSDLSSLDYYITNYSMWTQNGIVQVEVMPDNESANKIKTYALTQKLEAPLLPPKYVQTDIALTLTETQGIPDEVTIVFNILKVTHSNASKMIDVVKSLVISPENTDIQTLAIQKQLIYTNKLLEALLISQGVKLPSPDLKPPELISPKAEAPSCKRI